VLHLIHNPFYNFLETRSAEGMDATWKCSKPASEQMLSRPNGIKTGAGYPGLIE
jgi:hypothetical protein